MVPPSATRFQDASRSSPEVVLRMTSMPRPAVRRAISLSKSSVREEKMRSLGMRYISCKAVRFSSVPAVA
jgi:hypothetical protein